MKTPVVGIVASGSGGGKTTVLLGIISELKQRGLKVAVLKHGQHFTMAQGKDSSRFLEAGADIALIATPRGWQMTSLREGASSFNTMIEMLDRQNPDIILVEGYKHGLHPKVEVLRAAVSTELFTPQAELLAVISDVKGMFSVPCLPLDDAAAQCDFIIKYLEEVTNG